MEICDLLLVGGNYEDFMRLLPTPPTFRRPPPSNCRPTLSPRRHPPSIRIPSNFNYATYTSLSSPPPTFTRPSFPLPSSTPPTSPAPSCPRPSFPLPSISRPASPLPSLIRPTFPQVSCIRPTEPLASCTRPLSNRPFLRSLSRLQDERRVSAGTSGSWSNNSSHETSVVAEPSLRADMPEIGSELSRPAPRIGIAIADNYPSPYDKVIRFCL